jgi:hypothetical protein
MQTQIFEEPRRRPFATAEGERRSQERQGADFTTIRYVVVLGLDSVCRAELIDVSLSGIGILVDAIDSSTRAGDVLEIVYGGQRRAAEIRHITEKAKGYHLGIYWKTAETP